jgi:hypothetical protein
MAVVALLVSPALANDWQIEKLSKSKGCGIEVGGWMSSGIYANQYGAKDNGSITMREYGDGYTVDQLWVYAEKKADNGGHGLAVGGRVDFFWGADGPDAQTYYDWGWDSEWITSRDGNYGSSMPQLYGEIAYNNLSVKVGHFFTILGYESVPAPNNFFYSHTYMMNFEPYTHMGALAEYKLGRRVKILGGWTNGWDCGWLNPLNASTFLGGVSVELSDRVSLDYTTSFGSLMKISDPIFSDYEVAINAQCLVLKWQMSDRLNYVIQGEYQSDTEKSFLPSETIKYYGISQYLFYTLSDSLAAGMRVEWFRGENKWFIFPAESFTATGLTFGLNYRPYRNVVIRPEIRWDSWSGSPNDLALEFDDFERSSQFSGGFDCIIKY